MSAEIPDLMVYGDKPRSALLASKYFKVIDIDDKDKVKAKCQLCAQKCSVICGFFQNFKGNLKVRP